MKKLYLFTFILLISCSKSSDLHQYRVYTFGTQVDIFFWGCSKSNAQHYINHIEGMLKDIHSRWHAWQPGEISQLNHALKNSQVFNASKETKLMIEQAKLLAQQSNQLFNPAIGKLIALWGFHSDQLPTSPPDKQKIHQLIAQHPIMSDLIIQGNKLSSKNSSVQLDFGAFAKGYAVDLIIEYLKTQGIKNAIVNAGGDLRAMGQHPEKRSWNIGIKHPQGQGILAKFATKKDESVFTSGNYERYLEHEGIKYSHIIDPRTGMPVNEITSVTVVDSNAAVADAAATALVVAGVEQWQLIAKQMNIKMAMIVDQKGHVYMNPRMAKRIQFTQEPVKIHMSPEL